MLCAALPASVPAQSSVTRASLVDRLTGPCRRPRRRVLTKRSLFAYPNQWPCRRGALGGRTDVPHGEVYVPPCRVPRAGAIRPIPPMTVAHRTGSVRQSLGFGNVFVDGTRTIVEHANDDS